MYDRKNGEAMPEARVDEADEETWQPQFRPKVTHLPAAERVKNFRETEMGFSEEDARHETRRCLRCDLER
jgi:NADH-quinone oxidoreductase subunit F